MTYIIEPAGTLTVTREGAYLRFRGDAPMQPGLLRLWLSGGGRCEALGVMQPRNGRLSLDRRLSRRELARFPRNIERAELSEVRPATHDVPAEAQHEPRQERSADEGDTLWRRNADGSLYAEIAGNAYVALPSQLRRPSPCGKKIGGREYVIFPAPSCKIGDDTV